MSHFINTATLSKCDPGRRSTSGSPLRLRTGLTVPPFFLRRGTPGSELRTGVGRPPSYGDFALPSRCVPLETYAAGYPGERISHGSGVRLPCCLPDTLP